MFNAGWSHNWLNPCRIERRLALIDHDVGEDAEHI
jgi:hypothetical protein